MKLIPPDYFTKQAPSVLRGVSRHSVEQSVNSRKRQGHPLRFITIKDMQRTGKAWINPRHPEHFMASVKASTTHNAPVQLPRLKKRKKNALKFNTLCLMYFAI